MGWEESDQGGMAIHIVRTWVVLSMCVQSEISAVIAGKAGEPHKIGFKTPEAEGQEL